MPALKIEKIIIERRSSKQFLGMMLDENLSWEDHMKKVENKLTKNVGVLYCMKQFLDESSLKKVYFS